MEIDTTSGSNLHSQHKLTSTDDLTQVSEPITELKSVLADLLIGKDNFDPDLNIKKKPQIHPESNENISGIKQDDPELNSILNSMPNSMPNDSVIQLPIKKKKGRKSKKDKLLELQNVKPPEPVRLFPTLNEKIFDVVEIGGKEYYYDVDFSKLLDSTANYVGYKSDGKFVFYDRVSEQIEQIKRDNTEVEKILKNFGFGKVL